MESVWFNVHRDDSELAIYNDDKERKCYVFILHQTVTFKVIHVAGNVELM